jgi:HlyD family secretion protein
MEAGWKRICGVAPVAALALALGCARPPQPDAYGNVEATDVVVGAEAAGRLLTFDVTEGQTLAAPAIVGSIDPSDLTLQRDQLSADRGAGLSRVTEVGRQVDVLRAQERAATAQREGAKAQRAALATQKEIAQRNYDRTRRMFEQQAATAQQMDQAERDLHVLEHQVQAQDEQIAAQEHQIAAQQRQVDAVLAQRQTASDQVASTDARVAQVSERIRKSQITNPVAGTVLATYARAGEFVQTGQPLYKIANLSAVDVRAYVQEPQLSHVRLGGAGDVSFDAGGGSRRTLSGSISWISSQAEFAPTPIQTREERADLVYAIKIHVANQDGLLKIGMPVDVRFVGGHSNP